MNEDFKERMKRIRLRAGFKSQAAAAAAIGCDRRNVGMWEAPSSPVQSVGQEWVFRVARAYRVRPEWVNDLSSTDDGYPTDEAPLPPVSPPATPPDYVRVVDLGAEASMGDGRVNDDSPEVIRAVDYTQQYIRGLVGFVPPPGRLVLFTGRGDSMMPTIQPGESLLVDTGVTSFDGDGIYLVNLGNGQQIKRLIDHGKASGVYVHSDNPAYPAIPFPSEGIVAGKVYLRNRVDRFN